MATISTPMTRHEAQDRSYGLVPRLVLAALALSAGAIHIGMTPIHASESTTEGILFALVGWVQILLGVAIIVRPGREVLFTTIVVNGAVLAAYVISRTAGLPWGAHAGDAESVEAIDLMTAIFEGALIIGAAVLLIKPELTAIGSDRISLEMVVIGAAIPVLLIVGTSVALADPELVQHGHDDSALATTGGGHGHDGAAVSVAALDELREERCDLALNPAAYWKETSIAGIDTLMGGMATAEDHNAAAKVQGSAELDRIISKQVTGKGELGDAAMVVALAEASDDVYTNWLRWLRASGLVNHSHGGNELAPDDNRGMGGHLGPQPWHAMTDPAQCEQLAQELELARQTALKYATVADAKAAGWRQVTPYVPGIAAHFMNFSLVDDTFEIDKPEMILYDGTGDDARVVGLSYYIRHEGTAEPTQGFTGNNDHYHRHDGLCVDASGVIGDSTTTEEECAAMGGRKANGSAGWMSHAWVVPGCESPWGVFSGASPLLDRGLFADNGASGAGCAGSSVRDRYDLTPGNRDNTPIEVGGTLSVQ